jgi:crotonobetainyl-CoA:carnitine CoA-transferase CaiB-like acyl-CoA transferase
MLDFQAARWLVARDVPGQAGNDHPTAIPTGVFPTSDGHINIAASGQHIFARFCNAIGAERLLGDADYATGDKWSRRSSTSAWPCYPRGGGSRRSGGGAFAHTSSVNLPTQELGQHTVEILTDLGYTANEIDALRCRRAI